MKPEEAIHHLHTYSSTLGSGQTTERQHEEAKKMAIEALEKQIPKEPTDFVWRTVAGQMRLCPTCGNAVSRAGRYCQNCGQRVRV